MQQPLRLSQILPNIYLILHLARCLGFKQGRQTPQGSARQNGHSGSLQRFSFLTEEVLRRGSSAKKCQLYISVDHKKSRPGKLSDTFSVSSVEEPLKMNRLRRILPFKLLKIKVQRSSKQKRMLWVHSIIRNVMLFL